MFANVPPLKEYYRSLGDELRLVFLFIIPNIYSGSINWIQSNYTGVMLATLYQIPEEILLCAAPSRGADSQPLPPGCLAGTGEEAPGQAELWLCRSRRAESTDHRSMPIVCFLSLHEEGP